jgi:hypothetical protein
VTYILFNETNIKCLCVGQTDAYAFNKLMVSACEHLERDGQARQINARAAFARVAPGTQAL